LQQSTSKLSPRKGENMERKIEEMKRGRKIQKRLIQLSYLSKSLDQLPKGRKGVDNE
jgi:hypothetical protein